MSISNPDLNSHRHQTVCNRAVRVPRTCYASASDLSVIPSVAEGPRIFFFAACPWHHPDRRALHSRMLVLKRYAMAREILRRAQDDSKKRATDRVILERSEESRFFAACPWHHPSGAAAPPARSAL